MYVIRRHSRKLFFPAGLLALAWLPVLGGALLAARPELRRFRERVMQLSLPPLELPPLPSASTPVEKLPASAYPREMYASPAQLDTMLPWHTVWVTGNVWQDYFSFRAAEFVASQLHQEPDHTRGLRISFGPKANYAGFVRVLDIFPRTGIQRYWLDTQHEPLTFYSFTKKPPPTEPVELLDNCLLCDDVLPYSPPPPSWQQQLRAELAAAFRLSTWRPLFSPDWRYSTLLLLLLPLAATWQLRRLHTTDFRR